MMSKMETEIEAKDESDELTPLTPLPRTTPTRTPALVPAAVPVAGYDFYFSAVYAEEEKMRWRRDEQRYLNVIKAAKLEAEWAELAEHSMIMPC